MKLFLTPLFLFTPLLAQDLRTVTEPSIPPACATLTSKIGRAGTSLSFDDESRPDTLRIQAALNACTPGQAVILKRSSARLDAFLTGPLELRKGVTLVIAANTYLYGSRNPADYDTAPGVCGTITESGHGCRPLINGLNIADAAIMGDGIIDGRGGETLIGKPISWWNLADRARAGGSQNAPRLIVLKHCDNFTLYRITLMNSPNFHVGYDNGTGFTVWGVKLWCPERARNTDGIDPGNSTNITITRSFFHTGDDQIAIKAGPGQPTSHMTISHNHFYSGHGMSIGSNTDGGASAIRVSDLSIDGSDNGLRIKSNNTRGGLIQNVVYEDVCIRHTPNPVYMDTNYLAHASQTSGRIPVFKDITIRNVRVEGPGKVTLEALDDAHRLGIAFDNVIFTDPAAIQISEKHADIAIGPGPVNLTFTGTTENKIKPGMVFTQSCVDRFVPFPPLQ